MLCKSKTCDYVISYVSRIIVQTVCHILVRLTRFIVVYTPLTHLPYPPPTINLISTPDVSHRWYSLYCHFLSRIVRVLNVLYKYPILGKNLFTRTKLYIEVVNSSTNKSTNERKKLKWQCFVCVFFLYLDILENNFEKCKYCNDQRIRTLELYEIYATNVLPINVMRCHVIHFTL